MEKAVASEGMVQATYRESPYSDSSWEVLGELSESDEFSPMSVECIDGGRFSLDPMFPDYGGHYNQQAAQEMPGSDSTSRRKKKKEEEEKPKGLVIPEEEYARVIADALEKGRTESATELKAQYDQQLNAMKERVQTVLQDLHKQFVERLATTENQAVELAVQISEKIIGFAVEINPEYIVKLIQEALKLAGTAEISLVRVSPQDMEFIEVLGIQKSVKEFSEFHFESDETIKAGCVVETSAGEIDYQLDKAWDRVKESVVKGA